MRCAVCDDLLVLHNTKSDLQNSLYKLHQISKQYNIKIFTIKTNVKAFRGKKSIRTKIMTNNRILEQVSYFNYSRNDIGYDRNNYIEIKLGKFQMICGTISHMFRDNLRPSTCLLYTSRCV